MPVEIRGAHFLIRSAQLVRGTRLDRHWVRARGVHGNGEDWDPMGFPWEWV